MVWKEAASKGGLFRFLVNYGNIFARRSILLIALLAPDRGRRPYQANPHKGRKEHVNEKIVVYLTLSFTPTKVHQLEKSTPPVVEFILAAILRCRPIHPGRFRRQW